MAGIVANSSKKLNPSDSQDILAQVLDLTPQGDTRKGIENAMSLPHSTSVIKAALELGSGLKVSSQNTVPFCLWCAARHIDDFEDAVWNAASGFGDVDIKLHEK